MRFMDDLRSMPFPRKAESLYWDDLMPTVKSLRGGKALRIHRTEMGDFASVHSYALCLKSAMSYRGIPVKVHRRGEYAYVERAR